MNVTQTVEVPESRWLTIEVPIEVPTGPVALIFRPITKTHQNLTSQEVMELGLGFGTGSRIDPAEALKRCCGITKQFDISLSSDEFITMCRQDKELEDQLDVLKK
jgi:hypothetical protein